MSGQLLGVVATEALELGVDVGLLDCALAIGFPGSVASLRQQWGRAGRRGEGLALLVPGADALDRYFINHPEALLGRANEAAIIDPDEPRDPHRPSARCGPRAAAHRRRRRGARRGRARGRRGARRDRRARAHAGRPRLARRGLAGRPALAALRVDRRDRRGRAVERDAARHARAGARVLDGARGRGLPPPRRDVPGRDARSRRPRRARLAVRRALVHAAAPRDRDEHRERARRARAPLRRRAQLRRRRGVRPGGRLRAAQPAGAAAARHDPARPARCGSSRRARSGSFRPTS